LKPEKLSRRLKWYQITGRFVDDATQHVVAYVEATSPTKVLRYHGGRRTQRDTGIVIEFPTEKRDVKVLGKKFSTDKTSNDPGATLQVIPVTRYRCECGKVHLSEYPYSSMWCQCGKKALPVKQ